MSESSASAVSWPRARLLTAMESVADSGGVVVITAPAGSGKSTLVDQWQAVSPDRRRVVEVGKLDGDVDHLGAALVAALVAVTDVPPWLVRRCAAGGVDWMCDAMPALIEAVTDRAIGLAIDDVHLLQTPGSIELIQVLASNWPAAGILVLSGRQRPPIPVVRSRRSGPIRTIREHDLEFDAAELAAIATELGDPARADELMERTGGWPAGLRLALLAGRGRRTDRPVEADPSAYLRAEVMAEFEDDEIDLLGVIALLTPAAAPLLRQILNRDDVIELLVDARQRGLPMVRPGDGPDGSIAFHALLSDVLVAMLAERDPDRVALVLDSAIATAERLGEYHYAFLLVQRTGDRERLAAMCYRHLGHLVLNGQLSVLRAWLDCFDDAEIRENPALCVPFAHTYRPRYEPVVNEWLAPFADDDESCVLPDGTTPKEAVRRCKISMGLVGCTEADLVAAVRRRPVRRGVGPHHAARAVRRPVRDDAVHVPRPQEHHRGRTRRGRRRSPPRRRRLGGLARRAARGCRHGLLRRRGASEGRPGRR